MWCLFSHLSPISTNYYFTPSSYYSVRRPPITLSEKSIEQNVSWKSSITYKCSLVKWVIVHMALNQEANLIWFALSALYFFSILGAKWWKLEGAWPQCLEEKKHKKATTKPILLFETACFLPFYTGSKPLRNNAKVHRKIERRPHARERKLLEEWFQNNTRTAVALPRKLALEESTSLARQPKV